MDLPDVETSENENEHEIAYDIEGEIEFKGPNQEQESTRTERQLIRPNNAPTSATEKMTNQQDTNPIEYSLGGVTFKPKTKGQGRQNNGPLYTKAQRASMENSELMKLLENVQSKQQTPYHAITVSINDPEKMTNTYSLAGLLRENKRNLGKYDLLNVYTIVFPDMQAFDPTSEFYGQLKIAHGQPIQKDLFADYLRLTTEQVANSSKWYSLFMPDDQLAQQNLDWSLAYYEKNVKAELYTKIYAKMMKYEADETGGPLFLKLLLEQVTTTSEANLKTLIHTIETYKIKTSCPGEDIEKVVAIFEAIIDNIESLRDGDLPADTVENLLILFQSTSVQKFNVLFENMQKDLDDADISSSMDPSFRLRSNVSSLGNNIRSAKYVLTYAEKAYRNLLRKGNWDACLQKPPGQSAFTAGAQQPTMFSAPGTTPPTQTAKSKDTINTCFNCGDPNCKLDECPHPRDEARIKLNRAKHPSFIRRNELRAKWRRPEPHENNKRVINGEPHTWDPIGGRFRNGRWIPDQTPSDGQPNGGAPPTVLVSGTPGSSLTDNSTVDSSSRTTTSSSLDPAERRIQLHMQLQRINDELDRI
jgi:hypothetical protein